MRNPKPICHRAEMRRIPKPSQTTSTARSRATATIITTSPKIYSNALASRSQIVHQNINADVRAIFDCCGGTDPCKVDERIPHDFFAPNGGVCKTPRAAVLRRPWSRPTSRKKSTSSQSSAFSIYAFTQDMPILWSNLGWHDKTSHRVRRPGS